jgi:prepilin-type N-terminal cleavage/methylation domain-containing protein
MSMTRGDGRARSIRRGAGFTLIEVLIAVVLFVLISGLAFSVYQTYSAALGRQEGWRTYWRPAVAAVETLRADLGACVQPAVEEPSFVLNSEDSSGPFATLHLYTVVPASDPESPDRLEVQRIGYVVRPMGEGTPDRGVLLREARPLVGRETLGIPVTEELVKGIVRFSVQAAGESGWADRWTAGQTEGLPKAVRMILQFEEDGQIRSLESEVVVAAGNLLKAGATKGMPGSTPPRP